jgi:hypothetical protein
MTSRHGKPERSTTAFTVSASFSAWVGSSSETGKTHVKRHVIGEETLLLTIVDQCLKSNGGTPNIRNESFD